MLWDQGLSHIATSTHCARWHPVGLLYSDYLFSSLLWYISLKLNNQVYGLICLGRISTLYQARLKKILFYLSCVKLLRLIHNSAK